MFQQPSPLQFTEWKCGMRKQSYQQYQGNTHQTNFPNKGKHKFSSLINQNQSNNGYDPSNRLPSPNLNKIIPSESTATTVHNSGTNRVTKFIPPLKQGQSTNVYIDMNQMSYGSAHPMVPMFQNNSRYNEKKHMKNTGDFIRPNPDASVTQSNFGSMMPQPHLPNQGRNVNERNRRFDNLTVGLQDCDSMLFSKSHNPKTNEEIFNNGVQFQKATENYKTYGNVSRAPTPQSLRTISSAALPPDADNTRMLSLNLNGTLGNITSLNCKIFGSTEREKMFIFTGTVEKIMKWNKIFRNHFCYFELIASVVSIQEGSVKTQKVMLLRDKKGPVLQVVYYLTTHLDLRDFYIGQMIRCVGKMSGQNVFNAVSIRGATEEEVDNLQRLCLVCDQAVSHYLKV